MCLNRAACFLRLQRSTPFSLLLNCPPRQNSRVARLEGKVEPPLTGVTVETSNPLSSTYGTHETVKAVVEPCGVRSATAAVVISPTLTLTRSPNTLRIQPQTQGKGWNWGYDFRCRRRKHAVRLRHTSSNTCYGGRPQRSTSNLEAPVEQIWHTQDSQGFDFQVKGPI